MVDLLPPVNPTALAWMGVDWKSDPIFASDRMRDVCIAAIRECPDLTNDTKRIAIFAIIDPNNQIGSRLNYGS